MTPPYSAAIPTRDLATTVRRAASWGFSPDAQLALDELLQRLERAERKTASETCLSGAECVGNAKSA